MASSGGRESSRWMGKVYFFLSVGKVSGARSRPYLQLVPRLRIQGAVPPLSICIPIDSIYLSRGTVYRNLNYKGNCIHKAFESICKSNFTAYITD